MGASAQLSTVNSQTRTSQPHNALTPYSDPTHSLQKSFLIKVAADPSAQIKDFEQALEESLTQRLNSYASYLRGKMTRELSLKRAPRLVFLKSRKSDFEEKIKKQMTEHMPSIIKRGFEQHANANVRNLATHKDLENYITSKKEMLMGIAMARCRDLFSNEWVLNQIRKAFGSIEAYLQSIKKHGGMEGLKNTKAGKKVEKWMLDEEEKVPDAKGNWMMETKDERIQKRQRVDNRPSQFGWEGKERMKDQKPVFKRSRKTKSEKREQAKVKYTFSDRFERALKDE